MPTQYFRNQIGLVKIETTVGVDSVPTGAANAIEIVNGRMTPMEGQSVTRDILTPFMGAQAEIQTALHAVLEGEIELRGAVTAGTAPGYGPVLRACGLAQSLVASTRADYDPISTGFEAVSVYYHMDGTRHRMIGSRGGFGLRFRSGDIPRLLFRLRGIDVTGPAASALPTPTFPTLAPPLPVSKDNTPTFTLDAYAAVLQSLEIQPFDAVFRDRVNSAGTEIVDHPLVGTLTIDDPGIGTKNYFTPARSGATVAMSLIHGATAGNIVELSVPRLQIGRIAYGTDGGVTQLSMPVRFIPASGSPECRLTIR